MDNVFISKVEFKNKNQEKAIGGTVFAFQKASDLVTALFKIKQELDSYDKIPINVESIEPYYEGKWTFDSYEKNVQ